MSRSLRGLAIVITIATAGRNLVAQSTPGSERPQLTVSGVLFAQYAYALLDPVGTGHQNNFDITRAYLNLIGRFSDGVGGRLTGDIYRNADGSLSYRLKFAYATWHPSKSALTYKFGVIQTPFVEHNEGIWDYRMQGSDATDRAGYLSYADIGVAADGTWNGDQVTMSAGVYNGEFYSHAPGDGRKDAAGRLTVRLSRSDDSTRFGGLRITGFALVGKPTGGGVRDRYVGEVSYRSRRITLAAEVVGTADRVDTGAVRRPTTKGLLTSVFGVLKFPPAKVAVIARFDAQDPDRSVTNDRLSRVITGVSYQLNPNLRLLVDLDHAWYQGGSPTPALDAARSQALFQLQLIF
jgi:hypothetical protein